MSTPLLMLRTVRPQSTRYFDAAKDAGYVPVLSSSQFEPLPDLRAVQSRGPPAPSLKVSERQHRRFDVNIT
jgi:hypothetical protein